MNANMIDTLRYADRLKEAGVDGRQAEAMSRALNDELADNVVTKGDLDGAVAELRTEMRAGFARVDARFEAMESKFDGKIEAMESKFDGKFEAVDARIKALESKFGALTDTVRNMGQYTFLVLALVVALGLYNAVAPHFRTHEAAPAAATASPQPEQASSDRSHPNPASDREEATHPIDASDGTPSARAETSWR